MAAETPLQLADGLEESFAKICGDGAAAAVAAAAVANQSRVDRIFLFLLFLCDGRASTIFGRSATCPHFRSKQLKGLSRASPLTLEFSFLLPASFILRLRFSLPGLLRLLTLISAFHELTVLTQ